MRFKEGQHTELKRSLADMDSILKTITAFANSAGGTVYIGIDESGAVAGISVGRNTLENLAKTICSQIDPPVLPKIELREIEGKDIIEIDVSLSPARPHFHNGIAYKRVGRTNLRLGRAELEEMLIARVQSRIAFDSLVCPNASLDDIDEKEVRRFFKLATESGRMSGKYEGTKTTLIKLGLMNGEGLTNAALICFGKNPDRFFPQHGFRCVYTKSRTFMLEEARDMAFFTYPLLKMIDAAHEFFLKHVRRRITLEGLVRKEIPVIPEGATRELIINAAVHREYYTTISNYLLITDEEIEISNPGKLPSGLTIGQLYKVHRSIPVNPLLAKIAYLAGYIEQWGIGTVKVSRLLAQTGLPLPAFEEKEAFFSAVLRYKEEGGREAAALELIKSKKVISTKELAKAMGFSERAARLLLSQLVELGAVKRIRKGRRITYSL